MPGNAFDSLRGAVDVSLRACLGPARALQEAVLGISEKVGTIGSDLDPAWRFSGRTLTRSNLLDAEIFSNGPNLFVVSLRSLTRSGRPSREQVQQADQMENVANFDLTLYYIGMDKDPALLPGLIECINQVFECALKARVRHNSRFDDLRKEGFNPPPRPTSQEVAAANELRDQNLKALAIAIKASGGLLARDLRRQLPNITEEAVNELRQRLQHFGLVETDIVVVCEKSQTQVTRLPSAEAFAEMSRIGVRCACGQPIGEETMEEAVAVSGLGKSLIDKSRWMTVLILNELDRAGVSLSRVLIDIQVGSDEIDCVANINGRLAVFEFKDKVFDLRNAYSFGAKIGIFRPDYPIIVCTGRIGGDARDHFARARVAGRRGASDLWAEAQAPSDVRYIEELTNLRTGIEELAMAVYREDAANALRVVLPFAAVDGALILDALTKNAAAVSRDEPQVGAKEELSADADEENTVDAG